MNNLIFKTLAISALTFLSIKAMYAGSVTINNENADSISLKIVPENAPKEFNLVKEVPAHDTLVFNISKDDLLGKLSYAVEGELNIFLGDKCKNLSIDKDYIITFVNDNLGTTCLAHDKA